MDVAVPSAHVDHESPVGSCEPMLLEPYLRPMVWGGRNLERLFGKNLPESGNYGESWEISAHAHRISRIASGPFRGLSLTALCRDHADRLWGRQPGAGATPEAFPWLVKLLDCQDWLSIQVHPTDALAAVWLPGERGKTEAWVILDVAPGGLVYAGLRPGVTQRDLEAHLAAGTTDQCLHSFTPKVGDCIFLPAGTVHAVGGGVVMAEVQQTSDATFRLFDWNRLGADGKPRALHIQESLACINWNQGPVSPVVPQRRTDAPAGVSLERLVTCPHFQLDRITLNPINTLNTPRASVSDTPVMGQGQLRAVMVLEGAVRISWNRGASFLDRECGQTVLIPAASPQLVWTPIVPRMKNHFQVAGRPTQLLQVTPSSTLS